MFIEERLASARKLCNSYCIACNCASKASTLLLADSAKRSAAFELYATLACFFALGCAIACGASTTAETEKMAVLMAKANVVLFIIVLPFSCGFR